MYQHIVSSDHVAKKGRTCLPQSAGWDVHLCAFTSMQRTTPLLIWVEMTMVMGMLALM